MPRAATLAAIVVFWAGTALAQNMTAQPPAAGAHPMGPSGGPCSADREKFCKGVKPGHGGIIDCLEAHKAQISPICATRMAPAFKNRDAMRGTMNPAAGAKPAPAAPKPPG